MKLRIELQLFSRETDREDVVYREFETDAAIGPRNSFFLRFSPAIEGITILSTGEPGCEKQVSGDLLFRQGVEQLFSESEPEAESWEIAQDGTAYRVWSEAFEFATDRDLGAVIVRLVSSGWHREGG